MGTMRSTWLALALAVVGLQAGCTSGDGTRNGGDSDGDGTADSADCAAHSAERWRNLDGYGDDDGDGVGEGPVRSLCTGEALPSGWARVAGDCDDADSTRWRPVEGLYPDQDGDGATAQGPVTGCVGRTLDGYQEQPGAPDCDDTDARFQQSTTGWLDSDGDGVGSGQSVSYCLGARPPPGYAAREGDCAPDDFQRAVPLPYSHRDADLDGATVPEQGTLCVVRLPLGYHTLESGLDCDDADRTRWAMRGAYVDTDGDGFGVEPRTTRCSGATPDPGYAYEGEDCAPEDRTSWQWRSYEHRDRDGDGFTVPQSGTLCSGTALPAGYTTSANGDDCNDAVPTEHTRVQAWADADADGVGAGEATTLCTDGTVSAPWSATGTDCEPEDRTRWTTRSYFHVDRDTDGHTTPERGSVCTGAALPTPYFTQAAGNDCDDTQATLFRWAVLYPDADGDGVGTAPRAVSCLGQDVPTGLSFKGYDVNDADAAVQEDEEDDLMVELNLLR